MAGYFVAKLLDKFLERAGFDRLVERGGIKTALPKTKWDASDILAKTAFYFVMLCVLQLAFGASDPIRLLGDVEKEAPPLIAECSGA